MQFWGPTLNLPVKKASGTVYEISNAILRDGLNFSVWKAPGTLYGFDECGILKNETLFFRGKKERAVLLVVEACEVGENKGEGDSHGSEDRTQFSAVLCKVFPNVFSMLQDYCGSFCYVGWDCCEIH